MTDLETEYEEERRHADKLAEVLKLYFEWTDEDSRHIIAVRGTQITLGNVVRGALAEHELRRNGQPS